MGIGPVVAIPKALALAGLKLDDIGVIELNEAFAVQALAVIRSAGLDLDRINVNGGAIALGHPLGCTGAKLTATILREMQRREAQLRHGDDVHRRRPGRRGNFRESECKGLGGSLWQHRHWLPRSFKGGAFLIEESYAGAGFHARGFHRRAPRHRTHHRRVLEQGSRAESRGDPAPGAGRRRFRPAQIRRTGPHRPVILPEKFGGMEMDLTSAMIVAEADGARRLVLRLARRAHRHRHAAAAATSGPRSRSRSICRGWRRRRWSPLTR